MKMPQSLCYFTLFILLLSYIHSIRSKASLEMSMSSMTTMNEALKGFFYVQRMYPGNDPFENMKESQYEAKKVYLEVNDKLIFIKEDDKETSNIEDSIDLKDLYDEKEDNVNEGNCCRRVIYKEYLPGHSLKTLISAVPASKSTSVKHIKQAEDKMEEECEDQADKSDPLSAPSVSNKERKRSYSEKELAIHCLNLYVVNQARWRVCHEERKQAALLQMKILYSIFKSLPKVNIAQAITKVKVATNERIPEWTWEDQEKWGGQCPGINMQSPINIKTDQTVKADKNNEFSVQMHFTDVHTLVKKHFQEVIVTFINFGGIMKINFETSYLLFTPKFMSFKFPGETILDGQRSQGDIVLHFAEVSSETKTSITNGLELSIPIAPSGKASDLKSLDNLNMELWKHEVAKHGKYIPKKHLKKESLTFSIEELTNRFMILDPEFNMYFGSASTPPCQENVMKIVVSKPIEIAGCQFKLLRESSLLSHRPKEIHTRIEKPLNNRVVYSFDKSSFGYIPSLKGMVPQSFNKYLVSETPKATKNSNNKADSNSSSNWWSSIKSNSVKDKGLNGNILDELDCAESSDS